jgi:hypothetical protein
MSEVPTWVVEGGALVDRAFKGFVATLEACDGPPDVAKIEPIAGDLVVVQDERIKWRNAVAGLRSDKRFGGGVIVLDMACYGLAEVANLHWICHVVTTSGTREERTLAELADAASSEIRRACRGESDQVRRSRGKLKPQRAERFEAQVAGFFTQPNVGRLHMAARRLGGIPPSWGFGEEAEASLDRRRGPEA